MKRTLIKGFLLVCIVCLSALLPVHAWAEDTDLTYSVSFTDQELDDLLAPIALYPDPLLAQILPASTYPTEVADADAWLNSGGIYHVLTSRFGPSPSGQLPAIHTFFK